jgi:hypothetical protein
VNRGRAKRLGGFFCSLFTAFFLSCSEWLGFVLFRVKWFFFAVFETLMARIDIENPGIFPCGIGKTERDIL